MTDRELPVPRDPRPDRPDLPDQPFELTDQVIGRLSGALLDSGRWSRNLVAAAARSYQWHGDIDKAVTAAHLDEGISHWLATTATPPRPPKD